MNRWLRDYYLEKEEIQGVRICPRTAVKAVFQDPEAICFLFFCVSSDLDSRTTTKSCKEKVEIQAGING